MFKRLIDVTTRFAAASAMAAILTLSAVPTASAQISAFRQAVAETAARDDDLAAFYRGREFEGVWTGSDARAVDRRNALLAAMSTVADHGIPADRFDPARLIARLRAADTPFEQGQMEVELSRMFLDYARSVQSGLLTPRQADSHIRREVHYTPRGELLQGFIEATEPAVYLRGLPPRNSEYVRLMRAKVAMEAEIATGGWGPTVPGSRLDPGDSGPAVVALRNRLMAMGFLGVTVTASYDGSIEDAVREFQASVGLEPDGVAGGQTLDQINMPIERRLQSVLVAMERERWMNFERGERHVWVNLTDFTAAIVDDDRVTFRTRSVIGAESSDRQTPEFSDVMEHMVINPSWYVPRSIIVNEYLPRLRSNSGSVGHLQILDSRGRVVSRGQSFARYSASSFPYSMRQPPGPSNALGRVKFMFPNQYNIYLHDTPSRSLFAREVRAFSHGCIRLNDPLEFAYRLLERQTDDPQGFFDSRLRTGAETRVNLEQPIPVHIVYRTAFTDVGGRVNFRRDIYGRDGRIWAALAREGVVIPAVRG